MTVHMMFTVVDPGFSVGRGADLLGGRRPPICTLFGENICKNEKTGSCWGGALAAPPGSANGLPNFLLRLFQLFYEFILPDFIGSIPELIVRK